MPVMPFSSDAELVSFANAFLHEHAERFRKDIKICLTRDANNSHAYFPALITCIAFADFLSGLYAGKLDGHGLKELKNYVSKFMNTTDYTPDRLDILYECFRHKVAHLAQPYAVFDTHSKPKFQSDQRCLITWTVEARARRPPVEIRPLKPAKQILRAVTPWPVYYDHIVFVRLRSLASDIEKTIPKYLRHLRGDETARCHFRIAWQYIFPNNDMTTKTLTEDVKAGSSQKILEPYQRVPIRLLLLDVGQNTPVIYGERIFSLKRDYAYDHPRGCLRNSHAKQLIVSL